MAKIEILVHAFFNFFGFHKGYPVPLARPPALSAEDFDILTTKLFGSKWTITSSCNTVLVESDKMIIVDPGASAVRDTLKARLEELKLRPDDIDIVVNTHLHGDHIGSNHVFRNKPLIVHEKELDYSKKSLWPEFIDACVSVLKTQTVKRETAIAKDVRIIETPGHTPGSISVVVDTPRGPVAIVGDSISRVKEDFLNRKPAFWEPDKETIIKSWKKIRQLKPRLIIPGHDAPFSLD